MKKLAILAIVGAFLVSGSAFAENNQPPAKKQVKVQKDQGKKDQNKKPSKSCSMKKCTVS